MQSRCTLTQLIGPYSETPVSLQSDSTFPGALRSHSQLVLVTTYGDSGLPTLRSSCAVKVNSLDASPRRHLSRNVAVALQIFDLPPIPHKLRSVLSPDASLTLLSKSRLLSHEAIPQPMATSSPSAREQSSPYASLQPSTALVQDVFTSNSPGRDV